MSTYAVFGMTRHHANELAKKDIRRQLDKSGKFMSMTELRKEIGKRSDEIMESDLVSQLSTLFDAPQFAKEFRSLAAKTESRDLHIKGRRKSEETTKTGRPKMVWESVA